MPITAVILFNGLTNEIKKRNSLDFLEAKRQFVIDRLQKKAHEKSYRLEFNSSITEGSSLIIDKTTNYEKITPTYFESEFYLYGEIYQEGGKKPNIHISTKEYGNLTVSVTKEQIVNNDKKTYKPYGLKVRGKKNFEDGSLSDLVLLEFIQYSPIFDKNLLDKVIDKASENWNKISNIDIWLNNIKAEGI